MASKLTPAERKRKAKQRITRAQAATNKKVRKHTSYVEEASDARVFPTGPLGPSRKLRKGTNVNAGQQIKTGPRGSAALSRGADTSSIGKSSLTQLGADKPPRKDKLKFDLGPKRRGRVRTLKKKG